MAQEFERLFSPLKLGPVTIGNRIFSTAFGAAHGEDHLPGDALLSLWTEKAQGGLGLIVSEPQSVHRTSTGSVRTIENTSDRVLDTYRKMVEAVHTHGTKVFGQLWHGGRTVNAGFNSIAVWSASPVRAPEGGPVPHEIDEDEIRELVGSFGAAARRLKEAGFDGVEINAAQRYLLGCFLSRKSNIRDDRYGGSLENRMRIVVEVVGAVRAAVGAGMALGVRIGTDEPWEDGISREELGSIALQLAATGQVDYLCTTPSIVPSMTYPVKCFSDHAEIARRASGLPVLYTGRVDGPVAAEEILAAGSADAIGMTRATLADQDLPRKAKEGRLSEIRPCVGCNEACAGQTQPYQLMELPGSCVLNPAVGYQRAFRIVPSPRKKRVMIVGGGVAGLEAARVAAMRGHSISIYDKGARLGGQLLLAAQAPYRSEWLDIIRFYEDEIARLGVDVHLRTEVSVEMVRDANPDAVVVAAGARPYIPEGYANDKSSVRVVHAWDVLAGKADVGERVVVVAREEHRLPALSTAELLADRGKKVEVLNDIFFSGSQVEPNTLEPLYARLLSKGVKLTPMTAVKGLEGNSVVTYNTLTQTEGRLEDVDSMVVAEPGQANSGLYESLKNMIAETYAIGDCVAPRNVGAAIREGGLTGRAL